MKKSDVDLSPSLNLSDLEIQKTRRALQSGPGFVMTSSSQTQVIESTAPMQLKLKRSPAKILPSKKKKKKKLRKSKIKKKSPVRKKKTL